MLFFNAGVGKGPHFYCKRHFQCANFARGERFCLGHIPDIPFSIGVTLNDDSSKLISATCKLGFIMKSATYCTQSVAFTFK